MFLTSPADWDCEVLRSEWRDLSARRAGPGQIYQTSDWFDHVVATGGGGRAALAVTRDADDRLQGIAPIRLSSESLDFSVAGRSLGGFLVRTARILGGLATVPEDRDLLDALFREMARVLPEHEAVRLSCVATGSFLWRYLHGRGLVRDRYLVHVVKGVGRYHVQRLPATFEEYLAAHKGKKRYNLRRQARLLREQGVGRLELHRIESRDRVAFLLDAEAWMAPDAGRHVGLAQNPGRVVWTRDQMLDLAGRGLLRCYVLTCGDEPVGIIKGVQYGRTYSVIDTLYRTERAAFSPGATTLFLSVEDLLSHRPVEFIDFGFGSPRRSQASTHTLDMASVLLLKKSIGNRLRRTSHAVFYSSVMLAKRIRDWI